METVTVDLKDTPFIQCGGGNVLWETSMLFKRLSPLMSPTGREELIPAEIVICKKCGLVPKFYWEKAKEIPNELRSKCDEIKIEL
jgi:hypothetical protein